MYSDYKIASIRSAAVLTTSYVSGTVQKDDVWKYNQVALLVQITLGSLNSVELKIEYSIDNSTWFQKAFQYPVSTTQVSISNGEYTFTASGNYPIELASAYNFIRISVKGTGTVTNSSCTIDAILSKI